MPPSRSGRINVPLKCPVPPPERGAGCHHHSFQAGGPLNENHRQSAHSVAAYPDPPAARSRMSRSCPFASRRNLSRADGRARRKSADPPGLVALHRWAVLRTGPGRQARRSPGHPPRSRLLRLPRGWPDAARGLEADGPGGPRAGGPMDRPARRADHRSTERGPEAVGREVLRLRAEQRLHRALTGAGEAGRASRCPVGRPLPSRVQDRAAPRARPDRRSRDGEERSPFGPCASVRTR